MTPKRSDAIARKIAKALRGLDLEDLQEQEIKDQIINLRVTEADKAEIRAIAQELGISVSEYLLRLHRHTRDNLIGD